MEQSELKGRIYVPISKSMAHRSLIASALTGEEAFEEQLKNMKYIPDDVRKTAECLKSMLFSEESFPVLDVGESGSTYRFLVPISSCLGKPVAFRAGSQLKNRPMEELMEALYGSAELYREKDLLVVNGNLKPGIYHIDGTRSSQFVSGMLFALSSIEGESGLNVSSSRVSRPYIEMTLDILSRAGVDILEDENGYDIKGKKKWQFHEKKIEGDWSSGAFYHVLNSMGADIEIFGLSKDSRQGDRRIMNILNEMKGCSSMEVDLSDIPDLAPAIAAACVAKKDFILRMTHAERLRIKESDRAAGICEIIKSLGGLADFDDRNGGTVTVHGTGVLKGGEADCRRDHRLIMMSACLSMICEKGILLRNAEYVEKSYPMFFEDFRNIGGKISIEVT